MSDGSVVSVDGHPIGFAEFGAPDGAAVLWCHGGPGSRLEPAHLATAAADAGLRVVGIDRPGYGLSPPHPGRTIADWVPEALAVADHLGIDTFFTVGVSTGGAFALAVAALVPERVRGVVPLCAMTDMRWPDGRATMSPAHAHAVWDAPDREQAIAAAVEAHGENGSKLLGPWKGPPLSAADLAARGDPTFLAAMRTAFPAMFTFGLEGYADDRIADNPGWVTFDVGAIRCPVTVVHGARDVIVDVIHAQHTAEIVPGAQLAVFPELGHYSVGPEALRAVSAFLE